MTDWMPQLPTDGMRMAMARRPTPALPGQIGQAMFPEGSQFDVTRYPQRPVNPPLQARPYTSYLKDGVIPLGTVIPRLADLYPPFAGLSYMRPRGAVEEPESGG
jgi:hypothetical protein